MSDLRKALIKLASDNPELRKHLVPLLRKTAESANPEFWSGDVSKHQFTGASNGESDLAMAYIDSWPMSRVKRKLNDLPSTLGRQPRSVNDDTWFDWVAPARRMLWRSDTWMTPYKVGDLMTKYVPRYNAWDAKKMPALIALLAPSAQIQVAREYSVCLYIKAEPAELEALVAAKKKLRADEANIKNGELRMWWD